MNPVHVDPDVMHAFYQAADGCRTVFPGHYGPRGEGMCCTRRGVAAVVAAVKDAEARP